jgi:hypothetical protein
MMIDAAFNSSLEHILAELARLDLLIQAQVRRARFAQTAGGVHAAYINEAEVDALLTRPLAAPSWAGVALPPELLAELQSRLDTMAETIEQRRAASRAAGRRLRLDALAAMFGLNSFDRDALLVCLAPELDLRYNRFYAYLHDDMSRAYPSPDLLLSLLCPQLETRLALRSRLQAAAPLRRRQLVHLADDPEQGRLPWAARALRLDERIGRFLLDDDDLDERLLPYARCIFPQDTSTESRLAPDVFEQLSALIAQIPDLLCGVHGPPGVGKQAAAQEFCRQLELPLLLVHMGRLTELSNHDFARLARLAGREASLQGAALYWHGFDALLAAEKAGHRHAWLELLTEQRGLQFLVGNSEWEPDRVELAARFVRLTFDRPDVAERRQLWQRALGAAAEAADLAAVADSFSLSDAQIRAAAATARNLARWRDPAQHEVQRADLFAGGRRQSNRKLATLARKVEVRQPWAALVLPDDQLEQLREMVDQLRLRTRVYSDWGFAERLALGRGINALFCGPPGTGKTMAAGIIAGELGLDMYKIDLSTVVSKYIGETEKNLAQIFGEAETSNAILFFDEADALFGKRSEVKDSHDRYANIEISYLLQKMEEYSGISILASNLRKNLDEAFVRRMRFIVDFPFPDVAERRRIWQQIWPAATPCSAELDLDDLAERVIVAGGNIRNIALAAAFLAAGDGGVVTRTHLRRATRREYQKMGKLIAADE